MIVEKIIKTIEKHDLIEKKDHIVTGLSGGPDSVCLFHVLTKLAAKLDLTIHPVHLNHKFRPGEAERDQRYVEALCKKYGLSCHTFVRDCNELAARTGMTSEEAGRAARYEAFYQVAQEVAGQLQREESDPERVFSRVKIAVAQNANDQAETILFRILRGTGVDGLAGIAYKRQEKQFPVIRPLLDVYRSEIEAYCEAEKLEPVTDHTNNEAVYARNKIRLNLIPYLEAEHNENIMESLNRLGRIAAADKEYMWRQTEEAYEKARISGGAQETAADGEAAVSSAEGTAPDAEVRADDAPAPTNARTTAPDAEVRADSGSMRSPTVRADSDPATPAEEIVMDRKTLHHLHPAIRRRVMMKAFRSIGLEQDISEERLHAADRIIEKKQAPKTVEFPHGYRLTVAKGFVFFTKNTPGYY